MISLVTAVQYLQSNLPCDVSLQQHTQHMQFDKGNASESLSTISNLPVKMTSVLWKILQPIPSLIVFVVCCNSFKMKISKTNGISWMRMKIVDQPQQRIPIGQKLNNCVELNLLPWNETWRESMMFRKRLIP